MVLVKNSDTYDAFRRAATATEFTGQIAIKGLHNGTGGVGTNWTVGTLTLPRLALLDVDDQGGKEDISTQTLNMVVLKPDTASNDLSIAWTETA
jgi:hypothetical protein